MEVLESADRSVFVGDRQHFWQQYQRWMETILSIYFPNTSSTARISFESNCFLVYCWDITFTLKVCIQRVYSFIKDLIGSCYRTVTCPTRKKISELGTVAFCKIKTHNSPLGSTALFTILPKDSQQNFVSKKDFTANSHFIT